MLVNSKKRAKSVVRAFQGLIGSPVATAEARRKADRERKAEARKKRADARTKVKREFEFQRKLDALTARSWPGGHDEFAAAMSALVEQYSDLGSKAGDTQPLNIVNGRVVDSRIPKMSDGLSVDTGWTGCLNSTLLVSGGYDSKNISNVRAAHERDRDGHRVKPEGISAKHDDKSIGVKLGKNWKHFDRTAPKFQVNLGSDSESYKLTPKQIDLEKLIKTPKVRAELDAKREAERFNWVSPQQHKAEADAARRQSDEWLRRKAEAEKTTQVVENTSSEAGNTIDEKEQILPAVSAATDHT